MAINFLNNVDYNKNQLLNPRIQNEANDTAAGTPVEGQLYYNTTDNELKYGKDNGTGTIVWSAIDTDTGITSIELASAGDATSGNTITTNGTLTLSFDGLSTEYVNGEGNLVTFPTIPTVPSNIVETVATMNGDYIDLTPTTTATGDVIITADLNAVDGVAAETVAGNGIRYLSKNNKWAEIDAIPGTYTWTVSDGVNSTAVASGEAVTFSGTANEIEVAESGRAVTIGLPDDVTIGGNLTVTTALDMTDGQINNLANGTASTDAVNLGQVQGLIAGTGQFQGGYDATNDPGSPVISGSSNIALNTGDFYVVTVDGDITFSDQTISVEVGDLIFANTDIAANSNPASTDYTFVIQDQNIAGEGASDAATEKGVAGFNSAHFSVTANGFVSADIYGGGSALGIVPSGGAATTFLRGDGTWANPNSANTYADTITDSVSGTTFNHGLGDDVIVQLYDTTTKETVYADVERNGNYLNITFATTPTSSVRVLVQKIG